jgi:hypothetical protein
MRVYVTKYALTKGIQEYEGELVPGHPNMVKTPALIYKPFWHEKHKESVEHANLLRSRKLLSLKRKIIKLENLSF